MSYAQQPKSNWVVLEKNDEQHHPKLENVLVVQVVENQKENPQKKPHQEGKVE